MNKQCKAGLGRTGTLIGAYLTWKYGFTAHEAIAFMRIVRPGTVVGPQQQYMYVKQMDWVRWAAEASVAEREGAAREERERAGGVVAVNGEKSAKRKKLLKSGKEEERVVGAPATPPAEVDEISGEDDGEDGDVEMDTSNTNGSNDGVQIPHTPPRPSTPTLISLMNGSPTRSPIHSPTRP